MLNVNSDLKFTMLTFF